MSLVKYANGMCLILLLQQTFAATEEISGDVTADELDEEFLEFIGSVEAEEDEWFELFLSTIDEADEENITETEHE